MNKYRLKYYRSNRGPVDHRSRTFNAKDDAGAVKRIVVFLIEPESSYSEKLYQEIISDKDVFEDGRKVPTTAQEVKEFNDYWNGDEVDIYYLENLTAGEVLLDQTEEANSYYRGENYLGIF